MTRVKFPLELRRLDLRCTCLENDVPVSEAVSLSRKRQNRIESDLTATKKKKCIEHGAPSRILRKNIESRATVLQKKGTTTTSIEFAAVPIQTIGVSSTFEGLGC